MKKVVCFLMLALACCFWGSCVYDPGRYSIDREALNKTKSIELIDYNNPEQKEFITWVPDQFDKLVAFDFSKVSVIETLAEEKINDFLDSFSKMHILHTYYAYNSPNDVCIKVNYENGEFLIIWANYKRGSFSGYIGEYSQDGKVLSFWGSFCALDDYKDLVNNYFSYSI